MALDMGKMFDNAVRIVLVLAGLAAACVNCNGRYWATDAGGTDTVDDGTQVEDTTTDVGDDRADAGDDWADAYDDGTETGDAVTDAVDGRVDAGDNRTETYDADDAEPDTGVGALTVVDSGDRIVVTSSEPPTWRVEFATGSGSPGGGTAIALYIPSDEDRSIVEPRPDRTCCSGFALDNLEWRWRPWGGTSGTRSDCGTDSTVTSVDVLDSTDHQLAFEVRGSWPGVGSFTRSVTVTPDGYTATVTADYNGTVGEDSMWWVISMFLPHMMDGPNVTISDVDTGPVDLDFTPGAGTPLPSGINLPYDVHFPLTTPSADAIHLTVTRMADDVGSQIYEFFNQGNDVPAVGDYYMFYPRWVGSFEHKTYEFEYSWRFTPGDG